MSPLSNLNEKLTKAGFTFRANGQRLIVSPLELLTPAWAEVIRTHKAEILAGLNAANDGHVPTVDVPASAPRTPAPVPPEAPTTASRPAPALAVPPAPTVPAMPRIWPPMNAAEVAQAAQRHARLVAGGLSEIEADHEVDRLLLADRAGLSTVLTPPPAPARKKPQALHGSAHHPAWARADRLWQAHHFGCPACIAAGKGYGERCPEGLTLLEGAQC